MTLLRRYAVTVDPAVGNAIAVLLDHTAKLEMTLTLLRSGHESAFRHAPENAIIDAVMRAR